MGALYDADMDKRKILRALAVTICVLAVWGIMSRIVNSRIETGCTDDHEED